MGLSPAEGERNRMWGLLPTYHYQRMIVCLWWEPHCYNVFQVPVANLHCAAVGPKRVGCQALKILMTIKMVMMMMLMTMTMMTMIMCLVDFYPSVMTWRDSVSKYFPHDFFAKHQKQALCKICLSGFNSRPKLWESQVIAFKWRSHNKGVIKKENLLNFKNLF